MSYKIIVARFNEDIEWLNSEKENCIIYNKGNKLNIHNEIPLQNVGRESDTYLNYIITIEPDEGSFFIPVTLLVAFAIVLVFIISLLVIIFINIVLFFLESSTHPLRTLFP